MAGQALPSIAGFQIKEEVARGGSAVVYKATQTALQRTVAIKVLLDGRNAASDQRQRFTEEAKRLGDLKHPHIVTIYDRVETSDGAPGLCLEWVGGGTLAAEITGGNVSLKYAIEIATKLASALQDVHVHGIVHRDLKPTNVLLTDDRQPKLTDFGIAKDLFSNDDLTREGDLLGTPTYMAPEQALGNGYDIDARTDIHGFGNILYEMLTGRAPFQAKSPEATRYKILHDDAVPVRKLNSQIPKDLETICLTCLNKEPSKRYHNGEELLFDLERFNRHEPILAKPPSVLERLLKFLRRNWRGVSLSLLATVLVVGVVIGWIAWNVSQRELELVAEKAERALRESRLATQNAELSKKLADTMSYNSHISQAQRLAIEKPLGWTWENRRTLETASRLPVSERNLVDVRNLELRAMAEFDVRSIDSVGKNINPFCLAFNSNGSELAIGPNKGILISGVTIISLATQRKQNLSFPSGFRTRNTGIRALVFTGAPSSHLVAGTRSGELHVWDSNGYVNHRSHSAHSKEITGLTSFADGDQVITASDDKTVAVWQIVPEVKQLISKNIGSIISGISLSPDSSMLAVATDDGLHMLNAINLDLLSRDTSVTKSVSFHPMGRIVARASVAEIQLARLDGNKVTPYLTLIDSTLDNAAHEQEITHCTFSSDGSWLMSSSSDHSVKIWETATGKLLTTIPVAGTGNTFATFDPLGRHVAVTGDRETLLYETNDTLAQSFIAHQPDFLKAVAFHPRRAVIATATERNISAQETKNVDLALWSTEDGTLQKRISVTEPPSTKGRHTRSLSFLPSGDVLVYGGAFAQKICRWNTVDGTVSFISTGADCEIAFGPRGDTVWGIEDSVAGPSIFNLQTADSLLVHSFPSLEVLSKWTNSESKVRTGNSGLTSLCVGTTYAILGSRDGTARHFRTTDGGQVASQWTTNGGPIHCVAQSPDESLAAWGTQNGTLEVVSVPTGAKVLSDSSRRRSIESLAFSNDRASLASGSKDGTVQLWHLSNGGIVHVATLYFPGPVTAVQFSPKNDKLAVLVKNERALRIWDLGRIRRRLGQVRLDWKTPDPRP